MTKAALIVGAGSGISASFARLLAREGYTVALASRSGAQRGNVAQALRIACDATDPSAVAAMFARLDAELPPLDVVLYNPSYRTHGPITDIAADDVRQVLEVTAFGAFLVAQQAARRMIVPGRGALLFTGASASVKGYPQSAPFAMGKFALRGLAQSLARELAPKGIHVAHFVIDGAVGMAGGADDSKLDPEAIAKTYLQIVDQPRCAWTWEVELRPSVEKF